MIHYLKELKLFKVGPRLLRRSNPYQPTLYLPVDEVDAGGRFDAVVRAHPPSLLFNPFRPSIVAISFENIP